MSAPPAGSASAHTVAIIDINGNIYVSGGTFTSNGTSNNYTDITINTMGNVSITGGNFSVSRGSQGGTGTTTWNLYGDFSMSDATTQNSNSAGAKFVFAKAGTQTLTLSSVTFGGGGFPIQVDSGATVNTGTSVIRGSGAFTLNNGATLGCGHQAGLDSTLQNTGTRTLSAGAGYTFNSSAAQVTGALLPTSINNLTINNPSGVTLISTTTVNGTLALTSGSLSTGSDTLIISSTGGVTRVNGYVVGMLQKNVATGTNVPEAFEVGTGSTYAPVNVTFASVTTGGDLIATTTGNEHPNIGTSGIDSTKSVNRYWSLSNNGIGFTSYDAVFNFVSADIDTGANPSGFVAAKYSAGLWSGLTGGTRTATSLQVLGVGGFGDFVVGQPPVPTIFSNGTGGGNWASASTWQGGALPTAADSVVILGSDSVYVLTSSSCAALLVQSGGKLGLTGKLSLTNVTLNGKITVHADTLSPLGAMTVGNSGIYQHAQNGGRIPTATWSTGSTCVITGVTAAAPGNGNQNFHHIIWNCPAQTGNLNMGWNNITVGGNITILNTNTGRWQMTAPSTGNSATITIMGDVIQSAGNFTTNGTGNAGTTIAIHHHGNVNVTGGNFSISRGSQGGTGISTWNLLNGNFSISNATTQNSTTLAGGAKFVFARPGSQSLSLTSVTFGGGGLPIEVDTGATLSVDTSIIRGSGIFALDSGATLACGHPNGLDSTLQNTGTRTLSPDASYIFNGAASQVTGVLLPSAINNLTINNADGVTLTDSTTVNGTLSVVGGDLDLNGNLVTLGPAGTLSETAGNTVTGENGLITATRMLDAPNAADDVAGLGVRIGSSASLGSTVISRGHDIQSAGTGSIKRFFEITPTNNSGLNATLVYGYDDSELSGAIDSTLLLFRSTDDGSSWTLIGGMVNAAANTITLTSVDQFSRWTAAVPVLPPLPAQVVLVLPAHGATIGADSVLCVWQQSTPEVTLYWFERATDSLFTSPVIDSALTDTSTVTRQLVNNQTYWWRVKAKNPAGWGPYGVQRKFRAVLTGVADGTGAPLGFTLKQNYPNPFNPFTSIEFSVEKSGRATLELYNILGQKLLTLFDETVETGKYYTVQFNANGLSSGIYLYKLQSGARSGLKRLMLIK